jgi:hypothetical protein
LHPDYCVVAVIDLPDDGEMITFSFAPTILGTYRRGPGKHTYRVRRYRLDLPGSKLGNVTHTFSFSAEGMSLSIPKGLALSPDTQTLAAACATCCSKPLPRGGGPPKFDSGGVYLFGAEAGRVPGVPEKGLGYLDNDTLLLGATEVAKSAGGSGTYALSSTSRGAQLLIEGLTGVAVSRVAVFVADNEDVYAFSVAELRQALDQKKTLSITDGDLVFRWKYKDRDRSYRSLRSIAALGQDLVYEVGEWDKVSESRLEVWRLRTELYGGGFIGGSSERVLSHLAPSSPLNDISEIQTSGDLIAVRYTREGRAGQLVVLRARGK